MSAPPVLPPQPMAPDYVRAVGAFLQAQPAIYGIKAGIYIGADMDDVPAKGWGIAITKVPGVQRRGPALLRALLDIRFYAPTKHDAMRAWRTAHPYLEPPEPGYTSWTARDCIVYGVELVDGPADMDDPIDDSPFVWTRYAVTFNEVALTGG